MAYFASTARGDDQDYQRRMADSLIKCLGIDEAATICVDNGWFDMLGLVEAARAAPPCE